MDPFMGYRLRILECPGLYLHGTVRFEIWAGYLLRPSSWYRWLGSLKLSQGKAAVLRYLGCVSISGGFSADGGLGRRA